MQYFDRSPAQEDFKKARNGIHSMDEEVQVDCLLCLQHMEFHNKRVQKAPVENADEKGQIEGTRRQYPRKLVQPIDFIFAVI